MVFLNWHDGIPPWPELEDQMDAHESRTVHMNVGEAAIFLNLSKSWLNKARLVGNGPCFIKLGRRILYSTDDIS